MFISLCGFMGCGKSSVGKVLGSLLGCPVADLDSRIEEKAGKKIAEIFDSGGEPAFRALELQALRGILSESDGGTFILSLGGGTLTSEACAGLIRENTFCVYLRATADTLEENLRNGTEGRPMLRGKNLRMRIDELMERRAAEYEGCADLTIDTDGKTDEEIAAEIAGDDRIVGFIT